jgi:hypothetical protein
MNKDKKMKIIKTIGYFVETLVLSDEFKSLFSREHSFIVSWTILLDVIFKNEFNGQSSSHPLILFQI